MLLLRHFKHETVTLASACTFFSTDGGGKYTKYTFTASDAYITSLLLSLLFKGSDLIADLYLGSFKAC